MKFYWKKSIGCSGQFMRGNRKLMALASCAYIGIYVFCADARPRTAMHLTRGFAACAAASTPWHEGRVRIPPMFRCLYICRDLRPASPRRRDRWSPSDARDTNRASPDTNIHECRLISVPIFVQPRRGVFVSRRRRAFVSWRDGESTQCCLRRGPSREGRSPQNVDKKPI